MHPLLFSDSELLPSVHSEASTPFRDLTELSLSVKECTKCRLSSSRKNVVFGEGDPRAALLVIGEAPGADEDSQGRPFVGRSGQLLDKILLAVKFRREEVFICNILKCRPPQNRNPLADEIECCMPWLLLQLELLNPKLILLLGKVAANTILQNSSSMGAMRGRIVKWKGYDCMVTYHPAALLRNPGWKKACWEDVQMMRQHYDKLCSAEAHSRTMVTKNDQA
ncbi:MAG: uracil-DNA glycosylase [Chlorobiaceae bacterium]|jgi:uracil-DNA glycosylase|nr:uracil-DNA glycosylase [Chlorobiaceae bacterium]NTW63159.1 uracil-DNA glycosylase [Chlorobiaceae bacterium]